MLGPGLLRDGFAEVSKSISDSTSRTKVEYRPADIGVVSQCLRMKLQSPRKTDAFGVLHGFLFVMSHDTLNDGNAVRAENTPAFEPSEPGSTGAQSVPDDFG